MKNAIDHFHGPAEPAGELFLNPASDAGLTLPTNPAPAAPWRAAAPAASGMGLSRRSVVALVAAIMPGAAASAAARPANRSDRELLELGREYMRLNDLERAADERHARCSKAYEDARRDPSDVMRHRIEDHLCGLSLPVGPKTRSIAANPEHSDFYTGDEIKLLRHAPPPWNPEDTPAQKARADEIVREWDRWSAECDAFADEVGLTEAEAAIDEIVTSKRSLANRIAAMPATTLAGLRARALILADIIGEDVIDEGDCAYELMIRAIVRDLTRISV
jgi:hypothetical protein